MMRSFLFLFIVPYLLSAQTPFSSDSALSYLKTISVTIGARPMGSPNEHAAMEFALAKFREFGLHEVYLMPFESAQSDMARTSTNTKSGIAVGVLHGETGRIIIVGGHIDSASPFIPGANDNGSGSAAVIELARALSKEHLQSTIVFCLFGGEEAGLIGSKFFVNNFQLLDSVSLMLQLDMTNGSEILIPVIDSESGNTPVWLVKAAYEEFGRLGYKDLKYTTHFFTAMSIIPGGGVGSDHEPFLERTIPAIDFTSDLNDPIHTLQDDFEHFKPAGLKRSGDLVYALIHRFDNGVPKEKTGNYYLLQLGNRALFFPLWLLSVFIVVSILLSIIVLIIVRKKRTEKESPQRTALPGLKLFLFALLIQTCVWLSENIVGLLKGIRYPWMALPEGYYILGFMGALVGIALTLQFTRRIRLSHDPYRWFLRTVIFLLVFIILTLLINTKAALYPATALFLITLAMVVRNPWLKLLFWILSPHFMFGLFFSEGFIFMNRTSALYTQGSIGVGIITHVFFILFFALWSFPFLLAFAAIYFDSRVDLLLLKQWRTRAGLAISSTAFCCCTLILVFIPSYSDEWRQNITINQLVDLNTREGKIILSSNDYLKDIRVRFAEKDTIISTWNREILLKEFTFDHSPWIRIERTVTTTSADSNATFDIQAKLHFKQRPWHFTLSYSAGKNNLEDVSGPFITSMTGHSVSMHWESFIDTELTIPIHFKVVNADSITETLEARFVEMIYPVQIEKEFANVVPRTTLQRTKILHAIDMK